MKTKLCRKAKDKLERFTKDKILATDFRINNCEPQD